MASITREGTYVGNGAARNIIVGFIPDYVRVVNFTAPAVDEFFTGLAAGTSITTSGTAAVRASPNGITAYNGSVTEGQGFTVGAGLSVNASVYYYLAVTSGPGAD